MTSNVIAHRRMANLRLAGPPFGQAADVVRWLGAVQSQDYGPAKWSLGQRAIAVSDAGIDRAFAAGAILRTHVLRPTWHFVTPEDIRWLLELTGPRVQAMSAYYYRQRGLDAAVFQACEALLIDSLRGGQHRTRVEIGTIFAKAGITTDGVTLGTILMNAELSGVICSGALQGKRHTYALLEERAPQAKRLTHEEALAELTLRYFTSHGPATAKDLRWWSSLTLTEIKQGLAMVGGQLEHEEIDGVAYLFAPAATPAVLAPTVHLLQGYDEYVVGYSESKYLLDASGVARSLPEGTAVANGLVILDSQVAGHWKRTLKNHTVQIEVALYAPINDGQTRALHAAAQRHGEFLCLPATVVSRIL